MYYLYILQSKKDGRTYTGYTKNLDYRLQNHNAGKVVTTRDKTPLELIYSEKHLTQKEAEEREIYWKSGAGRRNLKKIFIGFPPRFRKRGEARSK